MRSVLVLMLVLNLSLHAAVAPQAVQAGVGLGPVRLHMSQAEVLHHLGHPRAHSEHWLCYGRRVTSSVSPVEYELMLLMDPQSGVQTVRTYSARYRTPLGVGPGSTLTRLRQKYRTRLQTLMQTDQLDTLWVKEGRGTVLFYVSPAQGRVVALEISI